MMILHHDGWSGTGSVALSGGPPMCAGYGVAGKPATEVIDCRDGAS